MSSWYEWLTTLMIATLAIHLSTGQGKITAIILIVECVPVLIESIRRVLCIRSGRRHGQ
jgi:hypothetical protein